MKEVYDTLRSKPEAELMANENTYRMLQSTSINLGDYENSTYFYEKYLEHFGEDAQVVANEAIHFYNTGNLQAAIPYMQRAIELDPALPVADQFMQLLMQMTPQ
jgi:tetratricopeptide (TPR) repeat protein